MSNKTTVTVYSDCTRGYQFLTGMAKGVPYDQLYDDMGYDHSTEGVIRLYGDLAAAVDYAKEITDIVDSVIKSVYPNSQMSVQAHDGGTTQGQKIRELSKKRTIALHNENE